jgi:hypothetical protein
MDEKAKAACERREETANTSFPYAGQEENAPMYGSQPANIAMPERAGQLSPGFLHSPGAFYMDQMPSPQSSRSFSHEPMTMVERGDEFTKAAEGMRLLNRMQNRLEELDADTMYLSRLLITGESQEAASMVEDLRAKHRALRKHFEEMERGLARRNEYHHAV